MNVFRGTEERWMEMGSGVSRGGKPFGRERFQVVIKSGGPTPDWLDGSAWDVRMDRYEQIDGALVVWRDRKGTRKACPEGIMDKRRVIP